MFVLRIPFPDSTGGGGGSGSQRQMMIPTPHGMAYVNTTPTHDKQYMVRGVQVNEQ